MLVQRSMSLRAFAGSWETWCDNKFPGDAATIQKCKSQPFGPFTLAPWTDVGAIQRGIPKPESFIVNAVTGGGAPPPGDSGSGDGGMAQASMFSGNTMLIGGAVLAGGLGLAYYLKFRKGSRRGRR